MEQFADIERAVADVVAAHHPPSDEWFWCELSLIRTHWNPVRHPFFARFSAGRLTSRELQVYAEEHEHLVLAAAAVTREANRKSAGLLHDTLSQRAVQAETDIELWQQLVRATGYQRSDRNFGAGPFAATTKCARIWVEAERSLAGDLVTLYALDALEPELALLQLNAVTQSYGFDDGPDTEYFRQRVYSAVESEAVAQAELQGVLGSADRFALLEQAVLVYRSYWSMLDVLSAGDKR